MKPTLIFLTLSLLSFCLLDSIPVRANNPFYNVKDYGAKGDNRTIDTKSIQEAINQCFRSGGGTVFIPSGTYISGSIQLQSNINLQLDAGAVIKGSPNLSDYRNMGRTSEGRNRSLIYAIGASNISITGHGAIDGNDSIFMDWKKIHPECCFDTSYTRQGKNYVNSFPDGPAEFKQSGRPGILITFIECHQVLMSDVTIKGAPNWCVHIACCDLVNVTGVNFLNSLLVPNADGIDISNCKYVNITSCTIVAGDDGIAISPCADGFCKQETENIHVSDCIITSRSSGIRIGWAERSIRRCIFQNLVINSNRGIGIFAKHDETIEDLLFDNIIINSRLHTGWWGIGEPIHISEIPLGTWYGVPQNLQKSALIRNIRFSNLNIVSENCIFLYGFHKNSLQNIDFINVRHYFKNSPYAKERGGNFELRPAFDNKYAVFKHDIPALYAKNVKGLNLSRYELESDQDLPQYCTNAIFCEDFSGLAIDSFSGSALGLPGSYAVIHLENGEDIRIANCKATPGTTIFLEQKNISKCGLFINNDLKNARIPVSGEGCFR